jgi:hypothetical protein
MGYPEMAVEPQKAQFVRTRKALPMRKALALTAAVAAGVVCAVANPASAGTTTTTTFTLTANSSGLAVSVPASASNIGTAATGATSVSGSLGTITVTDPRGALVANWTATVSSTDFTTGSSPSANETVLKSAITYSSGVGTALAGQVGAMVPSVGASLASSATAATWAGAGNNTVSWTPTLSFALLPSQIAGTYTGTVTHSVS